MLLKLSIFDVFLQPNFTNIESMNVSYAAMAKRMSAGFIPVKNENSEDVYVNTDMIVNIVGQGETCILNMYGGEMSNEGNLIYREYILQMELNEVHERIDQLHLTNFIKIKGVQAIFNINYSFHFSQENVATPIGMRLNVPGMEIYDQVDLVSLPPPKETQSHAHISESEKGVYWTHVNLILGLLTESNSNYWHVCLLGGKSIRVRGPLRDILEKHPSLRDIPLVNVTNGVLLNLNHTHYFNSGKNKIRLCDKLTIENSIPPYKRDEFLIENPEHKKIIKEFLHTGEWPEIHTRKRK